MILFLLQSIVLKVFVYIAVVVCEYFSFCLLYYSSRSEVYNRVIQCFTGVCVCILLLFRVGIVILLFSNGLVLTTADYEGLTDVYFESLDAFVYCILAALILSVFDYELSWSVRVVSSVVYGYFFAVGEFCYLLINCLSLVSFLIVLFVLKSLKCLVVVVVGAYSDILVGR